MALRVSYIWINFGMRFFTVLKVGSYPNDDNSVQIIFVLFCVVFQQWYFLTLLLPRKQQDFAENSRFSFAYILCIGIPILKFCHMPVSGRFFMSVSRNYFF